MKELECNHLTIGTFAKTACVNVETIRFYQRKGLLPEPQRPLGSIRRYGQADVGRVKFIKSAQRLGFTLDEIAQLLSLQDGTQCAQAAQLAELRLIDVRARLADLQKIEMALATLLKECEAQSDSLACPLINALQCCQ
jgi:MerR family transcriptional regulator, mercuric resistance operon regulatory protein